MVCGKIINMGTFDYALITFGAAFAGVVFSLISWFGIDALIRLRRNNKVLKTMMQEIQEELQFDIALLAMMSTNLRQELDRDSMPMSIPKLRHSAINYAISSGNIRLIPNFRKQRLVRYAAAACELFNEMSKNTERLLATLILKSDGETWAKYRINKDIEQMSATKRLLEHYLTTIQREDLPDEYGEDAMTTTNSEPETIEERILKQVKDNSETLSHIKERHNLNTMFSIVAISLAVLALSVTILQLGHGNTALGIMFIGILTFEMAAASYKGRVKLGKLLTSGAVVTLLGTAMTLFTTLLYPGIIIASVGLLTTAIGIPLNYKGK